MVLKELILTVSTLNEWMLTVSTVGGSGGVERTDFNCFYFGGRKWWS